ncbi:LysM peptidoglycan-binding domain-containing protein [Pseudorhodoferax sp. Leaf274]|uniref:LysM peptidoglycan-binding domain-containing protein n=1 Tax=Pseudorhodoferax sp. Leaf274 TaxID=1736318 RepID=UPI00190FFCEA|nr:LysM domain-containing protein [Pseudorhodoferax sp. Leaf274]
MTNHSLGIAALAAAAALLAAPAQAQNYPVTPTQRDTAAQVAQRGVALAELAPSAPDSYTVKSGDTLWGISGMFLARPWRWPELWGMNLQDIRNPHLIYPGQQLFLHREGGRAMLSARAPGADGLATVRVSPRVRSTSLTDNALPTLSPSAIEPFLTESLVVEENTLQNAPRIVATREQRVMLSKGDRAYARGSAEFPLAPVPGTQPAAFRVVRNAVALKDPVSGEVLGFEAYYLGKAVLLQGEGTREITDKDGKTTLEVVPASMDVVVAKEDIRVGDRLLPEPPPELVRYVPHAPGRPIDGRVVSIYGSGITNTNAAQSQVVAINKGTRDGVERGHVLTLLSDGGRMPDSTDPAKAVLRLPDENNGTLMVFRTFERVSYGLILDIQSGVKVGDRLVTPR